MKIAFYSMVAVYICIFATTGNAQNVSTIANAGGWLASGDGGAATAADIGQPNCIATDDKRI